MVRAERERERERKKERKKVRETTQRFCHTCAEPCDDVIDAAEKCLKQLGLSYFRE
jgi:hypothetical protein